MVKSVTVNFRAPLNIDASYYLGGAFWLGASSVLSLVGGILISVLFARVWPKDVYGEFSFLVSALGFMSLTTLPGMGSSLVQAISQGKDGSYKEAVLIVLKWASIGSTVLIIGAMYFYLRGNQDLALATIFSALAFPFSSIGGLASSFFNGKKNFKRVAIFSLVFQYSSIMATAVALLYFPSLVVVAIFSSWSSALASSFLTWLALREVKTKRVDKHMVNLGKHLSFSQIITIAADHFDRFLVPLILGFSANATYTFAILIPNQLHNLFKVLLSLAQPKIAKLSDKGLFFNILTRALQLEIPIIIVVSIYVISAPHIFNFLYPAYAADATFPSQIFAVSLLYYPTNLFGLGLIKTRKKLPIYYNNLAYASSLVVSLLVLTPFLGIMGAILSKVVSRLFLAFSQTYLLKTTAK